MSDEKEKHDEIMDFDELDSTENKKEDMISEDGDNANFVNDSDSFKEKEVTSDTEKNVHKQNPNPLIKKVLIGIGVLVLLGGSYVGYLMFTPGLNKESNNNHLASPVSSQSEVPRGITLIENEKPHLMKSDVSDATKAATPDINTVLNNLNSPQDNKSQNMHSGHQESELLLDKDLKKLESEEALKKQDIEELKGLTKEIKNEMLSQFNHLKILLQQEKGTGQQQEKLQELLVSLQKDNQALLKKNESQEQLILTLKAVTKEAYEKIIEYKKANLALKKRLKAKKRYAAKLAKKKKEDKLKTIQLSEGWKVAGANNQMVVLSHHSGTTEIKKIGDLIEGNKVVKINIQKGLIQTDSGVILIP